jgi:glutathione synthase/RimK-type ligase-like ATP-grasp enzyme
MTSHRILLLVDYRNTFYSSTREVAGSIDVLRLTRLLQAHGHHVWVEAFADVNLRVGDYEGVYVLYQSSEDPHLRYKEYIEDVLLGLQCKGAILVPNFYAFRAHHNKVFMEMLRDCTPCSELHSMQSRSFGTFEEYRVRASSIECPAVLKPSAGSRSRGVVLAQSHLRMRWLARRISRTLSLANIAFAVRGLLRGTGHKSISDHRKKFIVQPFIDGLTHDYKVLVYAERYFVLRRMNRAGDFRASGSGQFAFVEEPPVRLLEFVERVVAQFNTPFCSLDVAVADEQHYVLEFQLVSFGQYALEQSSRYFVRDANGWRTVHARSDLEQTFAHAVQEFLKNASGGQYA